MQLSVNLPDNIFFGINQTEQNLTQLLHEKLALELYSSHQISLTQGAKITSMDIYDFIAFLHKNHIEVIDDYDIESEVAHAAKVVV